jgi:EAL domain-containing protein (putative c-di-GMP-specific phosphodiesterase class I)
MQRVSLYETLSVNSARIHLDACGTQLAMPEYVNRVQTDVLCTDLSHSQQLLSSKQN